MARYFRSLAWLVPVLGLILLVWQALVQPTPGRLGATSALAAPGIEVHDTTVIGWGRGPAQGRKLWKLTARRISVAADRRSTSFVGVKDATFFRDGRPYARLSAGSAVYDRIADSLQVAGAVSIRLCDQDARLVTERVEWQGVAQVLELPAPVTLWADGSRLQAARARVEVKKQRVRVDEVNGDWKGIHLAADTCEYQPGTGMLSLTPLRLHAGEWRMDGLSAQINPRTGAFKAESVHMASNLSFLDLADRGRRPGIRVASTGLLVGLLAGSGIAAPGASVPKGSEPEQKTLTFDARYLQRQTRPDGAEVILLTDDVVLTHVDPKDPSKRMVLHADRVEVTDDKKNPIAVATGSPKVTDESSQVVAEKITVWLKPRRAVLDGKVKIVTQPKQKAPAAPAAGPAPASSDGAANPPPPRPQGIRDRVQGEVVITSDTAEYSYRTKNAVAEGHVVVTNKGRRLTLPKVVYEDAAELLKLTGPIDYLSEKNEPFHHEGDALYSLKEGAESFTSVSKTRVSGTFFIKEDDDEETAPGQEKKPAGEAPKTAPAVPPVKPPDGGEAAQGK